MYRYKVIDIHPIDRLYGVIKVGHVFETDRPAALMAWDSRRPEISGYSYGFIAGETVAAIKVEDITYQKEEIERLIDKWVDESFKPAMEKVQHNLFMYGQACINTETLEVSVSHPDGEVEPAPWIPVSERLPDFGERVLVDDQGIVRIGVFCADPRNGAVICFDEQDEQPGVIHTAHWMPLPDPPQK